MADAFACFGSDDDDSDVESGAFQDSVSDSKRSVNLLDRGRQLADRYNAKITENNHNIASPTPSDKLHSAAGSFKSSFEDQQMRASSLPWPSRPPLYLGQMNICKTLGKGGGRGYVAAEDLPPGTCVLIEEPVVRGWSDNQIGKKLGLESIQFLLQKQNAQEIVECIEELHPRKKHVDAVLQKESEATEPLDRVQIMNMMVEMNACGSHEQRVKALVAYAKENGIRNADGSNIENEDINRILLTLRYNGFDSGLYLHFSMFNHSEYPLMSM